VDLRIDGLVRYSTSPSQPSRISRSSWK
jgi:hypothetical protein